MPLAVCHPPCQTGCVKIHWPHGMAEEALEWLDPPHPGPLRIFPSSVEEADGAAPTELSVRLRPSGGA